LNINNNVKLEREADMMGIISEAVGKQSLNLILMTGHAGIFRRIDEGRKIAKKQIRKNVRYIIIQVDFEILYLLWKEPIKMIQK